MENKKRLIIIIITCFVFGFAVSSICFNVYYCRQNKTDNNYTYTETKSMELFTDTTLSLNPTTEAITEITSAEPETEAHTDFSVYGIKNIYEGKLVMPKKDFLYQSAKNDEAMKYYKEFLENKRPSSGVYLYDFVIPTREPDERYDTSYAFWDCNGDGLDDLIVESARAYYYITYKDDRLVTLMSSRDTKEICRPLNNGGFISRNYTGYSNGYEYFLIDINGNKIFSVTYGYATEYRDENTEVKKFWYDKMDVSEELYNELTKKYDDIGKDKIVWHTLYENYYDGVNHYDDQIE